MVAGPSVSIPSQPVDVTVEVRSRHLLGESEDEAEVEESPGPELEGLKFRGPGRDLMQDSHVGLSGEHV